MEKQLIFTNHFTDQLWADLKSGKALESYRSAEPPVYTKNDTLISSVTVDRGKIKLDPDKGKDTENAVLFYGHYKELNETQASDRRLWAYLSHVTFREYTMSRWGLKHSREDLQEAGKKQSAINYIAEHWFTNNVRDLRRHSLARLWWAAHLTRAPWEQDQKQFGSLKQDDDYTYTETLLSSQDIYSQVLERRLGRFPNVLFAVLEYLRENPDFAQSRLGIRSMMKELNLMLGVKKVAALDFSELRPAIAAIAEEISVNQGS